MRGGVAERSIVCGRVRHRQRIGFRSMLLPIDLIIVCLWSIIGLAVTASVVAFDRAADVGGLLAVLQ
jgi:hypothetical protein